MGMDELFPVTAKELNHMASVRKFETGATRSADTGKPDYEGYLSPLVIRAFGEYMTKHRYQADGTLRDSDNWQRGIPSAQYIKSLWRHFMDLWMMHRGINPVDLEGKPVTMEDTLAAVFFNTQGYFHEYLKGQPVGHGQTPLEQDVASKLKEIFPDDRSVYTAPQLSSYTRSETVVRAPSVWDVVDDEGYINRKYLPRRFVGQRYAGQPVTKHNAAGCVERYTIGTPPEAWEFLFRADETEHVARANELYEQGFVPIIEDAPATPLETVNTLLDEHYAGAVKSQDELQATLMDALDGQGKPSVYVAGPMRGYANFNFPAFDAARDKLRGEGWTVISPADMEQNGESQDHHGPQMDNVERDVSALVALARNNPTGDNAVYMLRGWNNSIGATAEHAVAKWLKLDVIYQEN